MFVAVGAGFFFEDWPRLQGRRIARGRLFAAEFFLQYWPDFGVLTGKNVRRKTAESFGHGRCDTDVVTDSGVFTPAAEAGRSFENARRLGRAELMSVVAFLLAERFSLQNRWRMLRLLLMMVVMRNLMILMGFRAAGSLDELVERGASFVLENWLEFGSVELRGNGVR